MRLKFRPKYVKALFQATAKQKWHKLYFSTNIESLSIILEQPFEIIERALTPHVQQMNDDLLSAKQSPQFQKSKN